METRLLAAFAAEQKAESGTRKPEADNQPAEESGEEAEVAANVTTTQSTEPNSAPPPPDEEGFVWPEGTAPAEATAASETVDEPAPDMPLPSLDELVQRIPAAAREALDELFRARFVGVKRIEKSVLKN